MKNMSLQQLHAGRKRIQYEEHSKLKTRSIACQKYIITNIWMCVCVWEMCAHKHTWCTTLYSLRSYIPLRFIIYHCHDFSCIVRKFTHFIAKRMKEVKEQKNETTNNFLHEWRLLKSKKRLALGFTLPNFIVNLYFLPMNENGQCCWKISARLGKSCFMSNEFQSKTFLNVQQKNNRFFHVFA